MTTGKYFSSTLSVSYGFAIQPRIARAQPHTGIILDHHSFSVALIARFTEFVTHRLQSVQHVRGQSVRFISDLIGHPLVMDARPIDSLLDVHSVIDDIDDHL